VHTILAAARAIPDGHGLKQIGELALAFVLAAAVDDSPGSPR
jgi:hypothetical protein